MEKHQEKVGEQISRQLLKSRSGEFDIESIHTLRLVKLGVRDLGCIWECTSLERLDLSGNHVTQLYALAGLSNLSFLNVSENSITSLEGLQALDNLTELNVAGNAIDGVDSIHCLGGLLKLQELRFKEGLRNLTNPICHREDYRSTVTGILPKLIYLDGEMLSGTGSEFFRLCAEIDDQIQGVNMNGKDANAITSPADWAPSSWPSHFGTEEPTVQRDILMKELKDCENLCEIADRTMACFKQNSSPSTMELNAGNQPTS